MSEVRWDEHGEMSMAGEMSGVFKMYSKEKSNGNFRVYKADTSRNPIGYIKKGRYSYKVLNQSRGYCAKIQVRRQMCGVYDKITTKMVISGHRLKETQDTEK